MERLRGRPALDLLAGRDPHARLHLLVHGHDRVLDAHGRRERGRAQEQLLRRVEVPSGFSLHPVDISRPPRAWLERSANAVFVSEPERGGRFAPFEDPEELRRFFRPFRASLSTA